MPLPEEVKEARRKYHHECDEAWADFDAEGNESKRIERIKAARVELEGVFYSGMDPLEGSGDAWPGHWT